jgi:hypothetical protein
VLVQDKLDDNSAESQTKESIELLQSLKMSGKEMCLIY